MTRRQPTTTCIARWRRSPTAPGQQIQEEASRTIKRNLAARRVVDVAGPFGFEFASVTTGHVAEIAAPATGWSPGRGWCCRWSRSGCRSPWIGRPSTTSPAARRTRIGNRSRTRRPPSRTPRIERCSRAIRRPSIAGIRDVQQPAIALPDDPRNYPDAVAQALTQLRLAGVEGPYALVLDAEAYTAVAETRDHGYPILDQLNRLVPDAIVWGPALRGGFLLTTRGGDYELTIGQDVSIGYLRHTDTSVDLYLQETFTFAPYTSEASVSLSR